MVNPRWEGAGSVSLSLLGGDISHLAEVCAALSCTSCPRGDTGHGATPCSCPLCPAGPSPKHVGFRGQWGHGSIPAPENEP